MGKSMVSGFDLPERTSPNRVHFSSRCLGGISQSEILWIVCVILKYLFISCQIDSGRSSVFPKICQVFPVEWCFLSLSAIPWTNPSWYFNRIPSLCPMTIHNIILKGQKKSELAMKHEGCQMHCSIQPWKILLSQSIPSHFTHYINCKFSYSALQKSPRLSWHHGGRIFLPSEKK